MGSVSEDILNLVGFLMSKIVGFTCGAFDLLHGGHIVMLEECKRNCDKLIVGLQTDPSVDRPNKNKPVQSMFERYVQLKAIKVVDEIIPYDTEESLEDLLEAIPMDIRFIGEEYKKKPFTGREIKDIEIYYTSRKHSFSSSGLRSKIEREKR